MANYDLGTARGEFVVDSSGAVTGMRTFSEELDKVDQKAGSSRDAANKVANGMALVGGTIAGGLAIAAKGAASFEERLSAVQAVSGATAGEMDLARKKALQLGKDTKFGASDAALAIEELVKAGVSLPDVMNGAADATVALAAAGEVELPEAASIASNAMNQFGLAAKDLPGVADSIAGAANASAIDVKEFGYSLSQVGAVANLAGLSFDETAVAIAEMGNAGIKGSDAGTSLKSFLSNLIPTTDKAMNVMEEMGLLTINTGDSMRALAEKGIKPASSSMEDITKATSAYIEKSGGAKVGTEANAAATQKLLKETLSMNNAFFDAQGNVKSMAEIQGLLGEATKDMTKEQKLANLETLFGSDAIRAAAVLAENGAAGYDKMATAMGKVTAADVAATRMDNFNGSMEQLKGSLETAGIAIGTVLLPGLRKIVDTVTEVVNKFLNLSDGTQKIITVVLAASAGALLLFAGFIKMAQGIQTATATMRALNGGMAIFSKEGKIAMALQKVWTGVQAAFNAVMAANPIAIIVIAIIALVAAFVIAYKRSETFRKFVQAALEKIKAAGVAVFGWFKDTALPWMKKVWDGIVAAGKALVSWFTGTLVPIFISVWKTLQSAAGAVVSWFKSSVLPVFRKVWAGIQSAAQAFMEWFNANVAPTFQAVFKVVGAVIRTVAGFFRNTLAPAVSDTVDAAKGPLDTFLSVVKAVFGGIMTAVKVAMGIIVPIIRVAFTVIKTIISVALNVLVPIFKFVFGVIIAYIKFVFGIIRGIIELALGIIRAIFGGGLDGIKNAFTTIFGSIIDFLSTVFEPVMGIFSAIWNGIKGFIRGVLNGIKAVFSFYFNAIRAVVRFVLTAIKTAIQFYINLWRTIITTALNIIKAVFSRVFNGLKNIVNTVMGWIRAFIDRQVQGWKNIFAFVGTIVDRVIAGFKKMWQKVSEWVGKVRDTVVGIKDKILGVFSGAKDWLFDIGKKIIQGLIDGVKNMFGTVKDTLTDLTGKIFSWKGPERRDKKLLIKPGNWIIEGLNRGILDAFSDTQGILTRLTNSVPSAINANYGVAQGVQRLQPAAMSSSSAVTFNNYGMKNEKPSDANARQLRALRVTGAL